MRMGEAARLKVHIEAAPRAMESVEQLLCDAGPALKSETRSRRKTRDGGVRYVVECDNQAELERLLFRIESVSGAVVQQCTCA